MSASSDPFSTLIGTPPPTQGLETTFFPQSTYPNDVGQIGPYRVVRFLRRASIGSVYLGIDSHLNRAIWLKVLRPNYLANPEARLRFVNEARSAATIKSPHLIQVYEVSELNGVPYVVFEHLQGRTLEEHLASHPVMPWAQILRLAIETSKGLAAAHALGVVHRELKPDTLWLEAPTGKVKIIDFGHVRPRLEANNSPLINPALIGLSPYTAPERAKLSSDDPRGDLFSLGVILYRLVTQELPFTGLSPLEVLTSILTDPPIPVSQRNPETPPDLARLIMQLLEKQPLLRPPSAAAVSVELMRIAEAMGAETSQPVDLKISICPEMDQAYLLQCVPAKSNSPTTSFLKRVSSLFRRWRK